MKKIGVYGGTFDPVHKGHMAAARAAAKELNLDRLLLIPDGQPPHKEQDQTGASGADRLAMTALAADRLGLSIPVQASDLELVRAGRSYTCDTLMELYRANPKAQLWLLVGTDMFLTLQDWRKPDLICGLAGICTFQREREDLGEVFSRQKALLEERFGAKVEIIGVPNLVETSSTEIRLALGRGERPEELDPSVYGYILRRGLYGTHRDLKKLDREDLRACSYSMIRAKRIPHVQGVEATAAHLAQLWGADVEAARDAAILHDCTKYESVAGHLELAKKYGAELDAQELTSEKLLHAKTGAAVAREVYGMPPEVAEAIRWHTTGKANMTKLEKILYIADYMEPTRDFPGVEKLRALVETDLDGAVMLGLKMSIEEVKGYGTPVHKNTVEALSFLREEHCNGRSN